VNQYLSPSLLAADDEALRPVRAQAGNGADHARGINIHRREV
jgi:hypothetical protein